MRADLAACELCGRRGNAVRLKRLAGTEYADVLICNMRHNKVRTVSAQVRSTLTPPCAAHLGATLHSSHYHR